MVCDEKTIPAFRSDSAIGTIDTEDRKLEDPLSWNTFRRRLTYTCPTGYVIENPNGVYNEQPDPIPEEKFTFEVECESDARWTPKPLHGGTVMPRCIRKLRAILPSKFPNSVGSQLLSFIIFQPSTALSLRSKFGTMTWGNTTGQRLARTPGHTPQP